MKYQHPKLTTKEEALLKRMGYPFGLESLFALRKIKRFYFSALKRAVRMYSDKYSHIAFSGHLEIPDNFRFDPSLAKPRGQKVDGVTFSQSYEQDFHDLPSEIQTFIKSLKSVIESYFACETNINSANIWRNSHIPESIASQDSEIFADAFHQDLVYDQYNVQLFILLQDTDVQHGPFEYLDPAVSIDDNQYYKKRNRKEAKGRSIKLTGKRGDFLLFSTGVSLHRAGIPAQGFHRDIFSIAFFPTYTNIGKPLSSL